MVDAADRQALLDATADALAASPATGAVLAVDVGGTGWVEVVGDARPDALVRLSSMTKPLAAALTAMLVEDGVLALDAPVTRWLPELADQPVLRRLDGPVTDVVPAERPPTVEDLLTMRLGFGFAFEVGHCPVAELAVAGGLGMGPPVPSAIPHRPDDWLARFAELPLMEQPGRYWRYETAFAVLGVLLARAGGAALPELFAERVLAPLGMAETAFTVPDGAAGRFGPCLATDPGDPAAPAVVLDPAEGSAWAAAPAFPNAGGGLVGTAADYQRFGRFLLAGGMHEGRRLLGADAVARMTTERVPAAQRTGGGNAAMFLDPETWGYGVSIRTGPGPRRYGWAGGLGTIWCAYPEHDTTAVLLTQVCPPPAVVVDAFRTTLEAHLPR